MPAYAFALLRNVKINDQIASYISRIDATLAPFGGAFKIHGGRTEVVEGAFDQTLVAIAFPEMDHARRWYHSEAYQAILPLRTNNAEGITFLIEGVEEGYQGREMIAKLDPC
ncbi:MAG: DUF1330 domain-containing protein [Polaromonas sp.]|nr:DUF1330 domain-containing protein [Polaromonas sp.]